MRGYLECMGVTELAIEAHEKGEADVSFIPVFLSVYLVVNCSGSSLILVFSMI